MCRLCRRRGRPRCVGPHDLHMADGADRRAVAGAHARRTYHPNVGAERIRQFGEEPLRALERAGQQIADPHRDRRRRRLVFLHHIEMGVERGNLIDFGQCQLHFLRQCGEMRRQKVPVTVLDQVQMLDQEIASAWPVDQQRLNLFERPRIDLPAFGCPRRPAPAGSTPWTGRDVGGCSVRLIMSF